MVNSPLKKREVWQNQNVNKTISKKDRQRLPVDEPHEQRAPADIFRPEESHTNNGGGVVLFDIACLNEQSRNNDCLLYTSPSPRD